MFMVSRLHHHCAVHFLLRLVCGNKHKCTNTNVQNTNTIEQIQISPVNTKLNSAVVFCICFLCAKSTIGSSSRSIVHHPSIVFTILYLYLCLQFCNFVFVLYFVYNWRCRLITGPVQSFTIRHLFPCWCDSRLGPSSHSPQATPRFLCHKLFHCICI